MGFVKGAVDIPLQIEPFKSFKQFKPFKSFKELAPLKPLARAQWCRIPLAISLASGAS
jgi:hypothetical protein